LNQGSVTHAAAANVAMMTITMVTATSAQDTRTLVKTTDIMQPTSSPAVAKCKPITASLLTA